MIKRKRRVKVGFSLIELIIVLAVMAIIALIAIPNFTAVRERSKDNADQQTMEVMRRILLVAETDIELPETDWIVMNYSEDNQLRFQFGKNISDKAKKYLKEQLSEVKKPQGISTYYTIGKRADTYRIDFHLGTINIVTYDSKSI